MSYPTPIILNPPGHLVPTHAIIWLHGLGASGHDFETIVPQLNLPADLAIRFIFPTAKMQPVTLNDGGLMRSWFDFTSYDFRNVVDEKGLKASVEFLHDLIEEQVAEGIPSQNILLAGFSQGGAVILTGGLAYAAPLAGLMALSTYFPNRELNADLKQDAFLQIKQSVSCPILMAHGEVDEICPLAVAQASRQQLQGVGFQVDWQVYPVAHHLCQVEVEEIGQFILGCFQYG